MSKKLVLSILFLCTSILVLIATLFIQPFATSLNLYRPNVGRVEKIIENRLHKNQQYANLLAKAMEEKQPHEAFQQLVDFHQKHLKGDNVELVVYRNDSLLFWSSNIDFMPDTANVQVRVLKKDSFYYLSQCVRAKNARMVFLVGFYVEYPYQNKLLRNGFTSDFSFIKDYKVSQELAYGAIPIRAQGVEPFYLVPIDTLQQKSYNNYKPILQWVAIALFYLGIFTLFNTSHFKKKHLLRSISLAAIIITTRALCIQFKFPQNTNSQLFGPELFAHTAISPSLGDFLVNSITIFVLVVLVYQFVVAYCSHKKGCGNLVIATVSAMAIWAGFTYIDRSVASLVMHSTLQLETYRIFSINIYSMIGYLALSFIICTSLLIAYTWFRLFFRAIGTKRTCQILISTFALFIIAYITLSNSQTAILCCCMAIMVVGIFLIYSRSRAKGFTLNWVIVVIAIISGYSVASISKTETQKDNSIRKVLAINLSSERDPLAELLIAQISQRLNTDALVRLYVRNIGTYNTNLYEYLRKNYFKDYLNKYELRATVCQPSSMVYNNKGQLVTYNTYFNELIENYGATIPFSRFYYLNMQNGTISYVGTITYSYGNEVRNLYIELNSRPNWEMLGYPELLIEGNNPQRKLYGYSYAKYHRGKLVNQGGDYSYPLNFSMSTFGNNQYHNFIQDDYDHLVYHGSKTDAILISRKLGEPLNTTASLVYSIAFFLLINALLLKLSRVPVQLAVRKPSFKNRVKWAMGIIIVLSMLLVASATIIYCTRSFEQRIHKNLGEKLMSVTLELYHDVPLLNDIENNIDGLTDRLIDLSNVFYSDINIYDTTGMLIVTSRPEIFDKDLMGERMNSKAWNEIFFRNSQKFVGRESIGGISFLSAYVPIIGSNNRTAAYLNLPYFTKEEELKDELYSLIIAIFNIYALLSIFAFGLAMVISTQITRPLELIRDKIRKVDISSNHNDLIEYSGNDEVGQLIGEYNRMVQELDHSARELAKTQREGAWREMARQVAHEVKNPLTPIKLSLQYLVKAKKEGTPDWDQLFARFAQSLDEQVNTLAKIASEFSAFAKLPMAKVDDLNLLTTLNDVMTVFSGYNDSNIHIELVNRTKTDPIIRADRDQIIRVFNNLVLNAIQSIEKGKQGLVLVVVAITSSQKVRVEVIDNGSGIEPDVLPKLFIPNFTTKSSGTGLGLAISREIVETFGGTIGVMNNPKSGATFYVEFLLKEE